MNWNKTCSLGLLVLGCMLDNESSERNGEDGDDLPEASRRRWRRRMATVAVSGDVGEWRSSDGLFPPGFSFRLTGTMIWRDMGGRNLSAAAGELWQSTVAPTFVFLLLG
ncbi:unnamed protein product [Lactuca virosa]|uniref:Secreted protein n=1 Tax=Lactuca virosa TaxID=75947 RepID=A0AAU9NA44_9ASTR|nr:unnamed protein product [Lactuca virosa]